MDILSEGKRLLNRISGSQDDEQVQRIPEKKHDIIFDGLGNIGLLVQYPVYYPDSDGDETAILRIKPGERMKEYYNIKDTDLDYEGTMTKHYLAVYLIPLKSGAWLLRSGFDYEITHLIRRNEEIEQLRFALQENEMLRRRIARLTRQLADSQDAIEKYIAHTARIRDHAKGTQEDIGYPALPNQQGIN